MSMEKNLKEILDEILDEVQKELDEATTTGNVDGYQTPYAFSKGNKHKKRKKKIATQLGYSVVGGDIDNINEAVNEVNTRLNKKVKSYLDAYLKGEKKNSPEHQHAIMLIMKGALTDANFHSEAKKLDKLFPKAKQSKYVGSKMEDVIEDKGTDIAGWAKWNGHDIIDAFAFYTNMNIGGGFGNKLTALKESVNEGKFKPSQVRSAISRVKKQLMRKWKQKGGYENFGQKELRQLQNKFDYNAYGDKDERDISHMLDDFDNWAMNYDGSMREDINEAKVKRPVNRWLELKNDESMHPHKKMAMGLKELKYQLREVEKFFNWYNKIKTINELDSDKYWKRTNKHIYTIKERLIKIAKTIQEIEK